MLKPIDYLAADQNAPPHAPGHGPAFSFEVSDRVQQVMGFAENLKAAELRANLQRTSLYGSVGMPSPKDTLIERS